MNVQSLYANAIDVKPRSYDFGTQPLDEGDAPTGWSLVYPDVDGWSVAKCKRWLREEGYEVERPAYGGTWQAGVLDAMMEQEMFSPMMNYIYPLPHFDHMDPAEAQAKLIGEGPVCVVMVEDEPHLALTGGGMDLSWDICWAYMVLGYLPPVHFCRDLPDYGEREMGSEKFKLIVEAGLRSHEIMTNWINGGIRRLTGYKERREAK
jgi:hypothetical protein